jgi:hypothetical protein
MYKALSHSIVLSSAVLSPSLLAAAPNSASSASGHFGRSTRIARVPARDWAQKPPAGHSPWRLSDRPESDRRVCDEISSQALHHRIHYFPGSCDDQHRRIRACTGEKRCAGHHHLHRGLPVCHRFTQPGPQVPGRLRCQVALSSCPLVSVTVMIAHSCFCWGGRFDGRFGQRYSVLKFAPGGANNQALRSGGRGAWFSPYLSGASRHHRRLDLDAVMGVVTENSEGPRGARLSKRSHSEPL